MGRRERLSKINNKNFAKSEKNRTFAYDNASETTALDKEKEIAYLEIR